MQEEHNKNLITFITEGNPTLKKKSFSLESDWCLGKACDEIRAKEPAKEKIDLLWQNNMLFLFKLAKVSNLAWIAQWKCYCYEVLTFTHSINVRP